MVISCFLKLLWETCHNITVYDSPLCNSLGCRKQKIAKCNVLNVRVLIICKLQITEYATFNFLIVKNYCDSISYIFITFSFCFLAVLSATWPQYDIFWFDLTNVRVGRTYLCPVQIQYPILLLIVMLIATAVTYYIIWWWFSCQLDNLFVCRVSRH